MEGIDTKTVEAVLTAGAYGTALVFFFYGAYVLKGAKTQQSGRNARWFIGLGFTAVLAMIGFDIAKRIIDKPVVVAANPKIYLRFSPLPSENDLPDPLIQYQNRFLKLQEEIEISQDGSSIYISLDRLIKAAQELKQKKVQLEKAYSQAIVSNQSNDLSAQIAAIGGDSCDQNDPVCGWKLFSDGDFSKAEQSFKVAATENTQTTDADQASALQGLAGC